LDIHFGVKNASGKCGELFFPQKCPNWQQIDFQGRVFHEISVFRASQPLFTSKLLFSEKHWKLTSFAQKKDFMGEHSMSNFFHQDKFLFQKYFVSWLLINLSSPLRLETNIYYR
jgi:hypothetical protein